MANTVVRWVRRGACMLVQAAYHQIHFRQTRAILRRLYRERGPLKPDVRRECDEYAREVLGWRGFAPWLRVYSAMAGEFKRGWIPDNYYGHVVVPRIKGPYGNVSNRKALSWMLFASDAFPDRAYRVNGINYGLNGERIDDEELARWLFERDDTVVFKAEGSSQGMSVRVLRAPEAGDVVLAHLGNGVFQTYVRQHPFFAEYTPSAVATIRMTTVVDGSGVASVRACYLRLARHFDTHVRSASQVRVAVEPASGRLAPQGYLASWLPTDRHPDTGVPFAGATIPQYAACVATVNELHRRLPYVRAIGWDVIVDEEEEIRVLEWNGEHNGIRFTEATQGPSFADLGWERLWRTKAPTSNEWVTAARQGIC